MKSYFVVKESKNIDSKKDLINYISKKQVLNKLKFYEILLSFILIKFLYCSKRVFAYINTTFNIKINFRTNVD